MTPTLRRDGRSTLVNVRFTAFAFSHGITVGAGLWLDRQSAISALPANIVQTSPICRDGVISAIRNGLLVASG
jgi:hypothetical protein